eukprot:TRINITY_DN215_c0_g1_i57.p1 TRINITY_DN215_c0_g1~~TRINITY_DN215_c0_g1_i57.p1  ORF type:complete len:356 (-),score=80.75 TRINITY_DN215_c0_g1_i57:504-1571(-)
MCIRDRYQRRVHGEKKKQINTLLKSNQKMNYKDQLKSFKYSWCHNHNELQAVFICLEQGCGQVLCPECQIEHQHKNKLILITKYLKSIIELVSNDNNQIKIQQPSNNNESDFSLQGMNDKLDLLSKSVLRIEKSCKQIQGKIDQIRSTIPGKGQNVKVEIEGCLSNIFNNQQNQPVLQQELSYITQRVTFLNYDNLQLQLKEKPIEKEFLDKFKKYNEELNKKLEEIQQIITSATQLSFENKQVVVVQKVEKELKEFKGFKKYFEESKSEERQSITDLEVDLREEKLKEADVKYICDKLKTMKGLQLLYLNLEYTNWDVKIYSFIIVQISQMKNLKSLKLDLEKTLKLRQLYWGK